MRLYQLILGASFGAIAFGGMLAPAALNRGALQKPIGQVPSIEQPFYRHVAAAAVGLGAIATELWWFSGNKPKKKKSSQSTVGLRERLGR
jgi:hypothetical protein